MKNALFSAFAQKAKKLTVIDWILIVMCLSAVFVFSLLFFRKSNQIIATIKVGEEAVYYPDWTTFSPMNDSGSKPWFADLFRVGQVEKDGLGRVLATITQVFSYYKEPTRKTVYLTVELNTVYNRASNSFTHKGMPVQIGSKIKLNFDNIYTEGLVTAIEGFPQNTTRKRVIVEAQLREENPTFLETAGTKAYVAEAIHVGDEVKDNNGQTVIKVLDKKVLPAQKTVTTSDGFVVTRNDPLRKDVYLTLEIWATKSKDKYFFLDDVPLLVDHIVPINTQTISIYPVITKFLSAE